MASELRNLSSSDQIHYPIEKKGGLRIAIIVSTYHHDITSALCVGAKNHLVQEGLNGEKIEIFYVPGAFELVSGATLVSNSKGFDAVICLGCVIQGETSHHDYINQSVAQSLANLSMIKGRPYIFGLLTTNNHQQALERAGGAHGNKGIEAAQAALAMIGLKQNIHKEGSKIGF